MLPVLVMDGWIFSLTDRLCAAAAAAAAACQGLPQLQIRLVFDEMKYPSGLVFPSFSVIFNRKMPFFPCISLRNEGKNRQGPVLGAASEPLERRCTRCLPGLGGFPAVL